MYPLIFPLAQQLAQQASHLTENPTEGGLWVMVAGTIAYIVRHWLQSRRFRASALQFEKKLEDSSDSSLSVSKNPGRTTVELLDVIHEDLKEFKRTTNARLDKLTEEVGYLRGRINGGQK
jgi:hypothetical protein